MIQTPAAFIPQRVWTWFVSSAALPFGDRFYGQRMMQRLHFLRQAQWWEYDRLAAYRDSQLTALIKVAYNEVPLYRRLLDEAVIKPDDIRCQQDLLQMPIVTKNMLRAGYPAETTRSTGQATYDSCSSGSTGAPFCVKEDAYTAGWYRATFLLMLEWLGWEIGIPHVQTGMTLTRPQGRRLKDILLRCHYVSAYDLTDNHLDEILKVIEEQGIRFLWGYPGSIYYLARRAIEKGWNQPLQAVGTWGDTLYAHYRHTIEQAFKTQVYNMYGIAEGMWISAQCGQGSHLHVIDTDVIVEYLDDNDSPVLPGQVGNLIVTRLHAGPMPLIRYKVGDIGISGGTRTCECGRGFEIMESVEGRDTDIVITPAGNRLIVHFFTGILEYFQEIDTFQIVQNEPDSIDLYVVPRTGFDDLVAARMIAQLKEKGADLDIRIHEVDEIPFTPGGKRRFVINKLSKN